MTAREAATYINKEGILTTEGSLGIAVRILDARKVYGRIDVLVMPISGEGETWVSESRIQWEKD